MLFRDVGGCRGKGPCTYPGRLRGEVVAIAVAAAGAAAVMDFGSGMYPLQRCQKKILAGTRIKMCLTTFCFLANPASLVLRCKK